MRLIIDIEKDYYEIIKYNVEHGEPHRLFKAVANGTPYEEGHNKLIELFNKYDILLVHIDGKIVPVKNSTKQECYNLLYEIQELIEWRKILFNKHLSEVKNENND